MLSVYVKKIKLQTLFLIYKEKWYLKGILDIRALLNICAMLQEYEFLDLSDVKEAELSSLQCALFEKKPGTASTIANVRWTDPAVGKY